MEDEATPDARERLLAAIENADVARVRAEHADDWTAWEGDIEELAEALDEYRGDRSLLATPPVLSGPIVGPRDGHLEPATGDVEADDADVAGAAAEASVGHPVGLDGVTAATEREDDGHRGSLAGTGPEGEWHPDLVGAAFRVWRNQHLDCWVADVVTRDRVRVCVALRQLVGKHALVWREDVAGFVPAGGESG